LLPTWRAKDWRQKGYPKGLKFTLASKRYNDANGVSATPALLTFLHSFI
jgi:hypothetical protein